MTLKESDILAQLLWVLGLCKKRGLLDYTRINTTGIPIAAGNGLFRLRPNWGMKGFADIEVVVDGRVGYMETKHKHGKLTDEQARFRDSRLAAGAHWALVKSLDQGIEFLRTMGVPIDGVLKGFEP